MKRQTDSSPVLRINAVCRNKYESYANRDLNFFFIFIRVLYENYHVHTACHVHCMYSANYSGPSLNILIF